VHAKSKRHAKHSAAEFMPIPCLSKTVSYRPHTA
jgi:hypothetical protein